MFSSFMSAALSIITTSHDPTFTTSAQGFTVGMLFGFVFVACWRRQMSIDKLDSDFGEVSIKGALRPRLLTFSLLSRISSSLVFFLVVYVLRACARCCLWAWLIFTLCCSSIDRQALVHRSRWRQITSRGNRASACRAANGFDFNQKQKMPLKNCPFPFCPVQKVAQLSLRRHAKNSYI